MKILRLIVITVPFLLLCLVAGVADGLAAVLDGIAGLAQRAAKWLEEQR